MKLSEVMAALESGETILKTLPGGAVRCFKSIMVEGKNVCVDWWKDTPSDLRFETRYFLLEFGAKYEIAKG